MKKPNFKKVIGKFTIIDLIIILCVIGTVAFAFIHIGGSNNSGESVSFDSSTLNKFEEKYLSFYKEGKIVKTHVGGYNSSTGKYIELTGNIIWVDTDNNGQNKILIDVNGKNVLAGLYKDEINSDIYIEQITLETSEETYNNVTEIKISPMNISNLDEITANMPKGLNYTVSTKIATIPKNMQIYQELSNVLYNEDKYDSIRPINDNAQDQILLVMSPLKQIEISSEILGNVDGKSDIIIIRVYDADNQEIEAIKKVYNVINVKKIS